MAYDQKYFRNKKYDEYFDEIGGTPSVNIDVAGGEATCDIVWPFETAF